MNIIRKTILQISNYYSLLSLYYSTCDFKFATISKQQFTVSDFAADYIGCSNYK